MGTSDLVKITSVHNIHDVEQYNSRIKKTQGQWGNQKQHLTQKDLLSFCGISNYPGLSIKQSLNQFEKQGIRNFKLSNMYHKRDTVSNRVPKSITMGHTIVQSFDYHANPNLTPKKVHHMGEQLFEGVRQYLKDRYSYTLDSAMISTHIDDDRIRVTKGIHNVPYVHKPHLHNHIVIFSYNSVGKSISPYLRKIDIYNIRKINDKVNAMNGLKDYHFKKLYNQVYPISSYTKKRLMENNKTKSNLQKAVQRFRDMNNKAFDKYPRNPKKAKEYRDKGLAIHYGYQIKNKKDSRNKKWNEYFTMNDFYKKDNQHIQWYNINNLRLLAWRYRKKNEKEHIDAEKCERVMQQFKLTKKLIETATTQRQYKQTMINGYRKLPPISTLNSNQKRADNQVTLVLANPKRTNQSNIKLSKNLINFKKEINRIIDDDKWRHNMEKNIAVSGDLDTLNSIVNKDGNSKKSTDTIMLNDNTDVSNSTRTSEERKRKKRIQLKRKKERLRRGNNLSR